MTSLNFQTAVFNILNSLNKSDLIFKELDSLPAPYNIQIKTEINRNLREIRDALISLPFWDYSSPDFEKIIENFFQNLRQHININRKLLENLLLSAIKLRFNYLSKPISTLLAFIFGDSYTKPKSEVIDQLIVFKDFDKVLKNLHTVLEELPEPQVSVYKFYYAIKSSWYHILNQSSSEDLLELFNPIFELYQDVSLETGIAPTSIFIDLFEDIGLNNFSKTFKSKFTEKETLTKEQFHETLSNILSIHKIQIESNLAGKKDTVIHRVINFSEIQTFAFQIPETIQKLDKEILLKSVDRETLVSAKRDEIDEIKELLTKFESSSREKTVQEYIIEEVKSSVENEEKLKEDTSEFDVEIAPELSYPQGPDVIVPPTLQEVLHSYEDEGVSHTTAEISAEESSMVSEVVTETDSASNELKEEPSSVSISQEVEQTSNEKEEDTTQQLNDYASSSYPGLNQLIDEQKRKQFIEELFYSMENEYDILVSEIDEAKNLEEALQKVNNIYNELGIYTEMPIAKEFFELVKRKFTAQTE